MLLYLGYLPSVLGNETVIRDLQLIEDQQKLEGRSLAPDSGPLIFSGLVKSPPVWVDYVDCYVTLWQEDGDLAQMIGSVLAGSKYALPEYIPMLVTTIQPDPEVPDRYIFYGYLAGNIK